MIDWTPNGLGPFGRNGKHKEKHAMKKNKGFTLIELMIVVAIIAIIAAIAIPNLLRSRMSANEAGAAGAMRTISTGEVGFQASALDADPLTGVGQYASLDNLGPNGPGGATANFIDQNLAAGTKSGYIFTVTVTADSAAPSYTATGTPSALSSSGIKAYFVDQSGVIRFEPLGAAPSSTSLAM